MAAPLWWRRLRLNFGISAPRMAVRSRLPWWGRTGLVVVLLGLIGGMWYWGYDFGQIFGGFNRKEVEQRLATAEADSAKFRSEATELRARNAVLDSDIAMARGAQEELKRQATQYSAENAQLKEDLAFLQKLVSDSSKTLGLQIPRVTAERDGEDMWRVSVLVVRGGNPKDEFVGNLVLSATISGPPETGTPARVIVLPEDDAASAPALRLKFKYYQRVEGRFRVPPGARITTVAVRAFEAGQPGPRATRTLTLN